MVIFIFGLSFDVWSISSRTLLIRSLVKVDMSAVTSMISSDNFMVAPNPMLLIVAGPASGVDSACRK